MAQLANAFKRQSDYRLVRKSAFFDAKYYIQAYPEVGAAGIAPLTHYMEYGYKEGKRPSAKFDPKYYLDANPDVGRAGVNPLVHWLRHGVREGRSLVSSETGKAEAFEETALVLSSGLFDAKYYIRSYPDVEAAGIEPLTHYMEYGYKEGKRPSAVFDPKYYFDANPDVGRAEVNPLVHWLRHGVHEGRSAFSEETAGAFQEMAIVLSSGFFDATYYANKYPDVGLAGMSAIDHYMKYGGLEGRSPSPYFDGARYLREQPDVAACRVNPIVHWLMNGRFERRRSPVVEASPFRLHDFCRPRQVENNQTIRYPGFGISIITPAYNTEPYLLKELYQTIANQTYADWEWIVVDDCSQSWGTLATLRQLAAGDKRVKIFFSERNLGISGATNIALGAATKNFVALVDHDDLLPRDALQLVADAWHSEPDLDLLYTDECKLSMDEEIYDILLKPDYSPSYIENTMYISHLSVYRKNVIDRVGGFRSEYDGTQDFDLALRVFQHTRHIRHVPGIGYLWRAIPNSTAFSLDSKSYAVDVQRLAVTDYAKKRCPDARVLPGRTLGFWHIDYPLQGNPLVSFVIPTAGGSRNIDGVETELLENCLESLDRTSFCRNREYVVSHNGDLDGDRLARLRSNPRVRLVLYDHQPFNLAEKINLGVAAANGEFVCLLNDDTQILTDCGGDKIVSYMQATPIVGAMSTLLLFADRRVQHNGMVILQQGPSHYAINQNESFSGHANQFACRRDVIGVTGALMFVRKADFTALAGFDMRLPLNYNDVDFCLRLRKRGRTCVVDPNVRALHFESASEIGTLQCEREKLLSLHPKLGDPFFNPLFDQRDPSTSINENFKSSDVDTPDAFRVWLDRRIQKRVTCLVGDPDLKLTVGLPIYNQPAALLKEAYRSLVMQTHPNFEIIIVDDGSSSPDTLAWIEAVSNDPRATVIRHQKNIGINGANRTLVNNMTGNFLLLVDADDYVTADALQIMADAIRRSPKGHIFYSDEFKADMQSRSFSPFNKPDFDPILIMNCCYPTHLMAISKDLLIEIDAYADVEATWCHDYDTILKSLARGVDPIHVPELLYAWRINPGSTASLANDAKPETLVSQRFVLERLLSAKGLTEKVDLSPNDLFDHHNMWRVTARGSLPDVNIVNAEQLWLDNDARGLLAAAANKSGYTALIAEGADRKTVLEDLSVLLLLDHRVVASSGIFVSPDGIVRWSGGLFGQDGVIEPYAGKAFEAGYHGQLYCQRCTDILFPVNLLIKNDALLMLLREMRGPISPTAFVIALGRHAQANGLYVAITPHVRYKGSKYSERFIPLDRTYAGTDVTHGVSRWLGPYGPNTFR